MHLVPKGVKKKRNIEYFFFFYPLVWPLKGKKKKEISYISFFNTQRIGKKLFNLNAQAASLFTTELIVTIKKSSAVFLI